MGVATTSGVVGSKARVGDEFELSDFRGLPAAAAAAAAADATSVASRNDTDLFRQNLLLGQATPVSGLQLTSSQVAIEED